MGIGPGFASVRATNAIGSATVAMTASASVLGAAARGFRSFSLNAGTSPGTSTIDAEGSGTDTGAGVDRGNNFGAGASPIAGSTAVLAGDECDSFFDELEGLSQGVIPGLSNACAESTTTLDAAANAAN